MNEKVFVNSTNFENRYSLIGVGSSRADPRKRMSNAGADQRSLTRSRKDGVMNEKAFVNSTNFENRYSLIGVGSSRAAL